MSNLRSQPEVKYELLLHTYNNRSKLQCKDYIIIIASLATIICVTSLTLCLSWGTMNQDAVDNLDFSLYGPTRTANELMSVQQQRAEYYANVNSQNMNIWENETAPTPPDPEVPFKPPNDTAAQRNNYKLVCYYSIPSGPNINSSVDLLPEMINATLCTHINIAFAGVANNNITPLSSGDEMMYSRVNKLKEKNPALKVLISVNGNMSLVVRNHTTRKQFIKGVTQFLEHYSLDGVDLDWEFPESNEDRKGLAILIQEFREKFQSKYLITVAVAAPEPIVLMSYMIREMAEAVDWINLMSYDFHFYTKATPFTGPNAPLRPALSDRGYFVQLNTNWSAHFWESQGMPKSKIVIGMPTYAHTFNLVNPKNNGFGAPAHGYGSVGSGGFASYPEVCQFLENGAERVEDWATLTPYAYKATEWISYDDDLSLSKKTDFVRRSGYAGAMVWNLNSDDFNGVCSRSNGKAGARFPLVGRIKNVLVDEL